MEKGAPQIRIRGRVRQALRDAGFRHIGTATFEASGVELVEAVDAVKGVLDQVATGKLDNLWIYVDQPREVTED